MVPASLPERDRREKRRRPPEKESYPDYANYIAKYITEYEKLGLPISWMTVQNEPLAVQTWDSCEYTAEEEKNSA